MEERVLLEELCEVRKSVEELRLQYSNIKDMLELLQREMFGMSKYLINIILFPCFRMVWRFRKVI